MPHKRKQIKNRYDEVMEMRNKQDKILNKRSEELLEESIKLFGNYTPYAT